MPSPFVELEVGSRTVKVTNPDKVYFPARGETKLDLVQYFIAVGDGIVRALYERPCQLKRQPEGVGGEVIWQKRVPEKRPEWIETARVTFPSGRHADELCVTELAHVVVGGEPRDARVRRVAVAPRATPRSRTSCASTSTRSRAPASRRRSRSRPSCTRCSTRSATSAGRRRAATAASTSTAASSRTGSSRVVRRCALAFAREIERRAPELVTTAWWKEERGERVFVDYNQNARDRTILSAYSVRGRPDATVSAPVTLGRAAGRRDRGLHDRDACRRASRELGDLHAGIDDAVCDLRVLLEWVEREEAEGVGEAPYPPNFPKMPGEPTRVQPSRAKKKESDASSCSTDEIVRPPRRAHLAPRALVGILVGAEADELRAVAEAAFSSLSKRTSTTSFGFSACSSSSPVPQRFGSEKRRSLFLSSSGSTSAAISSCRFAPTAAEPT